MSGGVAGRRTAYYVLVIAGAIAVHQIAFADTAGTSAADFFRRNSEAYALMVLIPLYWDVFGWAASPQAARPGAPRRAGWWYQPALVGWVVALLALALVTQGTLADRLGLTQSIVTLGEAFVAAPIIAIYTAWSRGIPAAEGASSGAQLEPWSRRIWFYGIAAAVVLLAYQQFAVSLLGDAALDWVQVNLEAWSALLLIPLYFDLVAVSGAPLWLRVGWYAALAVVPILTQSGALEGVVPDGLLDWLGRSTEAFIAAIVISIYFEIWRGRVDHHHPSHPGEVSEGVA